MEALMESIKADGHSCEPSNGTIFRAGDMRDDTDMLIAWSLNGPGKYCKEACRWQRKPLFVIELGYFDPYQRRRDYKSISLLPNGEGIHNNSCGFVEQMEMTAERLKDVFGVKVHMRKAKPIKGKVVILGQVPGDTQLDGLDIEKWCDERKEQLESLGMDVTYRPHPQTLNERPADWKPLSEEIEDAELVVGWNSTSLVECIIKGIPFYCGDKNSQYRSMSCALDNPVARLVKVRKQFLANLAWCNYSTEEIRKGMMWEHMLRLLNLQQEKENGKRSA